jgi:hypothetical protein
MIYRVRWDIDVDAGDPVEAAREALRIQRDPESTALCFYVENTRTDEHPVLIDLMEGSGDE